MINSAGIKPKNFPKAPVGKSEIIDGGSNIFLVNR